LRLKNDANNEEEATASSSSSFQFTNNRRISIRRNQKGRSANANKLVRKNDGRLRQIMPILLLQFLWILPYLLVSFNSSKNAIYAQKLVCSLQTTWNAAFSPCASIATRTRTCWLSVVPWGLRPKLAQHIFLPAPVTTEGAAGAEGINSTQQRNALWIRAWPFCCNLGDLTWRTRRWNGSLWSVN
jgi:hypothetical protein